MFLTTVRYILKSQSIAICQNIKKVMTIKKKHFRMLKNPGICIIFNKVPTVQTLGFTELQK